MAIYTEKIGSNGFYFRSNDERKSRKSGIFHHSGHFSIRFTYFNEFKFMQHFEILKLFSDIGGAAGLMLGMSFATVIGIIDWLISFLTNLLMGRYRTVRRLTRKYSEV